MTMSKTTTKNYIEVTNSGKIHVNRSKLFKSKEFKNLIKSLRESSIAKNIREKSLFRDFKEPRPRS